MERVVEDWDLAVRGVGFALSLSVSILSTLEVYAISSSLLRGDPELSHGLQVRRWFMASVGSASGARSASILLEMLYSYICGMVFSAPSTAVLVSSRLVPSLLYFTMYSLLTVYLAQLCYTVNGLPFFHVRNFWFFCNFSLYLLVVISLVFFVNPDNADVSFFIAYLLNLAVFAWYGTSVFKVIPSTQSSTATGLRALTTPTKKPSQISTGSTARVLARLWPLVVVCGVGVCLSCFNFLLLMFHGITSSSVEIVFILLSEILPSAAFLYVMPKLDNSFDEPSLLSLVVRVTTSPFASPQPETQSLAEGSRMAHQYSAV